MPTNPKTPNDGLAITSFMVLLGRLVWIVLGPLAASLTAVGIVTAGTGWLTTLDLAYCIVVTLMVCGRWVEHQSGQATTSYGEPATWQHFRRYVIVLLPAAAAHWIVANVLGNHLLTGD
jgi:hypothetical protein